MKHEYIPKILGPEALSDWLRDNCIAKDNHVKRVDYEPEQIQEFEHIISNNSAAILELEELKKNFGEVIKNGTNTERKEEDDTVVYLPADFTIPPTKGIKALKANIEYYIDKIQQGFEEEVTMIYMIPVPETKRIIAVNVEGVEFPEHSRDMNPDEENQHTTLFTEAAPLAEVSHEPKKQKKVKEEPMAFGEELDL